MEKMSDTVVVRREDFEKLSVSEQNVHLYDMQVKVIKMVTPIVDAYGYVLLVKRFGVGVASIATFVITVGGGVLWFINVLRDHWK